MRRVKAKSPEEAAFLRNVRKDFRRYLKELNRNSEPASNRLQARILVEITCPICMSLFADTVDAEKWAEGSAWVWCKQPGHRYAIDQSDGTMERVEKIRATWCAGKYFILGMEVTWMHRKRGYRGEIIAIVPPYQDALQMVPSDTPKNRLKVQVKDVYGFRAVLKNHEGAKPVFYVVDLHCCKPVTASYSQTN